MSFFSPKPVLAYPQTYEVCYSQCAAYKFYWKASYCWDFFANNCIAGAGGTAFKVIMMLKDIAMAAARGTMGGIDVGTPIKTLFICKPHIESCIVPQLNSCSDACSQHNLYYAANLSVLSNWANYSAPGLFYNDDEKQLYVSFMNNGTGYAWDLDVDVTWGHTPNRDKMVSGGGQLVKETIAGMTFEGAQRAGTYTTSEKIMDFMIDQTRFHNWLKDYKAENKHVLIPYHWEKVIPFSAPEGEYTKVIINVDGSQMIPESNEKDNTYILEIDKLPEPATYKLENIKADRTGEDLGDHNISFDLTNTGELGGKATISFTDSYVNYSGKVTITRNLSVGETTRVTQPLHFDVSKANDGCALTKTIIITVVDDQNRSVSDSITFPLRAGLVYGRITDLKDKPVKGVTVSTSTGQTAISGNNGFYHLSGIPKLGKITITATHPEYSLSQTKDVIMSLTEIPQTGASFSCETTGLTHHVNFVMKDQDVLFTVTVKDTSGNPVNAHVLAVNSDFRTEADINDSGPLSELQPGKYTFTISAPGYKTISQDVNAVPNDQNLEFTLEKLQGRPNDNGLHLITPKLLWKKTLGTGERIISQMNGSKNGNLLVAYVLDNKAKNSNLFFLELLTGRQIKMVSVPYALGNQGFVELDASYDGGTVGLSVDLGILKDNEHIMKAFDSAGNEFGTITLSKGRGGIVTEMDVSPDGFYLCPGNLFNKGLHKYTRYETEGKMDYKKGSTAAAYCGEHFLRNNNIVTSCEGKQEGLCEETLSNQQVRIIGDPDESAKSTIIDSAYDDRTIVVRTYKKLYYFGKSTWNKELKSDNMYKSVAVSPGSMYTIVTEGNGSSHLLQLKIFGNTGGDKTPDFTYRDVKFVFANDKGLFFAEVVLNRIQLYQVGEYDSVYNPPAVPTTNKPLTTSDLSYYDYDDGVFRSARTQNFNSLEEGKIYRADSNITLDMLSSLTGTLTSYGTLNILAGTLFSIDINQRLLLLKGQMTADFNSPATIYAIKFDRYDMNLFQSRVNQFIDHTLPESEYFIIKNIHTKFTVINNPNKINVAVDSGQVQVLSKKIDKFVSANKQITIDGKNNIKESVYLSSKTYLIITVILIVISSILLFIYRKSKTGKKILHILKVIAIWFWKTIEQIVKLIWTMIKKVAPIIWNILKTSLQKLILFIKKLGKKKK